MESKPKFTKIEQAYIKECFDLSLARFLKNPLNRNNLEDIRKVVNYRHDNMGQIGVNNHQIMHSIFSKMKYCKDGKTTMDEREAQIKAKEEQTVIDWETDKNKLLTQIDEKVEKLLEMKMQIQSHDISHDQESEIQLQQVQVQMKKEFKEKKIESQKQLVEQVTKSIDEMTIRELIIVAKAKGIVNYSRMKKEVLLAAVRAA